MRPQVFIVEGEHDASKLKQALGDVHCVITNGSEINKETLKLIKTLDKTHDVIVFTDPDYAGERIRKIVSKDLEHVYHVFLKRKVAFSKNKKKIGIEHAHKKDIIEALSHMQLSTHQVKSEITIAFLYDCQLIGHKDSKIKRRQLAEKLHLGHVNGKTLKKRLDMFNVSKKQIIEVMHESST